MTQVLSYFIAIGSEGRMKVYIVAVILLIGLLLNGTQSYASSSDCITSQPILLLASADKNKVKKDKKSKERKKTTSRVEGLDGKSSRKLGKHGKYKRK
jgi:hypothetical protein